MKKSFALLAGAAILFAACQKPVAVTPELTVNGETELTADIEGDIISVAFTSNVDWTADIDVPEAVATLNTTEGIKGEGVVKVTVMKNEQPKNVVITLALTPKGGQPVNVTITQRGVDHIFADVESLDFTVAGGELSFNLDENVGYTLKYDQGDWYKTTVGENGKITVKVDANAGWAPRKAYIKITASDTFVDEEGNPVALRIYLNQAGHHEPQWESSLADAQIGGGNHYRLALSGDNLIVSTGSEIHILNAKDGKHVAKVDLSAYGMTPESITNDDAGNIAINVVNKYQVNKLDDAGNKVIEDGKEVMVDKATVNVFVLPASKLANISSLQASDFTNPLKNWDCNIYTCMVGNVQAAGDLIKDGVISMFFGNCNYWTAWQVKDGVAGEPVQGTVPVDEGVTIWGTERGVVTPAGASLTDGLYFTGYGRMHNGNYSIMYCSDPSANTWNYAVDLYGDYGAIFNDAPCISTPDKANLAGNEMFCCLSTASFNGTTLVATVRGKWGWDDNTPHIVIANPATHEILYDWTFGPAEFKAEAGDDIVLSVSGDKLMAYAISGECQCIACVAFPKL